jgi:hypothetical protein
VSEVAPDGIIIPPPAVDPKVFETLVQPPEFDPDGFIPTPGEDPEEYKEARRRQQAEFDQYKPEHVLNTYFQRTDVPVIAGEYRFRVRQYLLKEALETTELTTKPRHDYFSQVKVTIYRSRLKLQTYNGASFSEYLVPLFEPSFSIPLNREQDLATSFIFNHALLLRLVQRMPEDTPGTPDVEFIYIAEKKTLSFQTQEDPADLATVVQKDFQLSCEDRAESGTYRSPIPLNPTFLGRISPVILRKAVNYAAVFARKDETRGVFNLIELRDGVMYGGTSMQIGRMEAAALKGVNLKIKFESIATVEQMLARMNADDTSVLETERYTLLTDGPLVFGFERYSFTFPDVTDMYQHESDNHVLAPRGQLLRSLALLAAVDKSSDLLVELRMTGESSHVQLHLMTHESTGKECRDFVRIYRDENPGKTSQFPPWAFSVHIKVLLELVRHFESTNVHLEVYNKNALYVWDDAEDKEGQCTAGSLLCILTQAETNCLRERKMKAAAAVRRATNKAPGVRD